MDFRTISHVVILLGGICMMLYALTAGLFSVFAMKNDQVRAYRWLPTVISALVTAVITLIGWYDPQIPAWMCLFVGILVLSIGIYGFVGLRIAWLNHKQGVVARDEFST